MLLNSRALHVVANRFPRERPLDAGPARCSTVDTALEKELEASAGLTGETRLRAVQDASDAEWVATMDALYYVWPETGLIWRAAWSEVSDLSLSRAKRVARVKGGKVRIVSLRSPSGILVEFETGSMAAKSLYKVGKEQMRRPR